ncbi:hypothetical protein NADE_003014 [Nannochloris sp. 'desiccata']|nr:hypothetical protein KSW81_000929 [Chlorella desiccata (nom. nud.)]KAH7620391.1 hypothetical protein NADE_003014 [Chlorella desiccata (nom. nud.)]
MTSHLSPRLKRERSDSTNHLLFKSDDDAAAAADHIHIPSVKSKHIPYSEIAAPLQHLIPGESKQDFFSRLSGKIEKHLFSAAHTFDKDGIYLYKRPVRSSTPQHTALLAQAGTVFHHVVVYLKRPGEEDLVALEFCPSNGMDVTQSLLEEAPAAPVLKTFPELPEPEHLPMLHINLNHHALDALHIEHALTFACGKAYQVMKNNCISFADFCIRCLTGNRVKNAPLLFDYLVGEVPKVDSPLLPLLQMMTQMSWFDVTDGSRLMREFLEKHGAHVLVSVDEGAGAAVAENRNIKGKEDEEDAGNAVLEAGTVAPAVAGDSTWSADTKAIDPLPSSTMNTTRVHSAGGKERSSASSGWVGKKKAGPKLPPRTLKTKP